MIDTRPVPRIASVSARSGCVLEVRWADGGADVVDLSGWIASGGEDLALLAAPAAFAGATVTDHGLTVQWGDDDGPAIDSVHLERLASRRADLRTPPTRHRRAG